MRSLGTEISSLFVSLAATGDSMKKLIVSLLTITLFTLGFFICDDVSEACTRLGPVVVRHTCEIAEYIVRATAIEYSQPPRDPNTRTTGVPDSKITFRVEEVLKGDSLKGTIELNGYLTDTDEFNDHPPPYNFVRKSGRAGSCFANTYRKDAQFLLFLKRSDNVKWPGVTAAFTVNIDPLAPVNEQLHSPDDPWIYYIKGLIEGLKDSIKSEKTHK